MPFRSPFPLENGTSSFEKELHGQRKRKIASWRLRETGFKRHRPGLDSGVEIHEGENGKRDPKDEAKKAFATTINPTARIPDLTHEFVPLGVRKDEKGGSLKSTY